MSKGLATCCALALVLVIIAAVATGYVLGAERPLGDLEKRAIAIDYACGPGQNWRMMKFFCGSIPKKERKTK